MSKQSSKSHPEDTLGGHSKASQKSEPAHQYSGQRTSTNPDESKGGFPKVKPTPGHAGPRTPSEAEETIDGDRFKNRSQEAVRVVSGRAQKALKEGPHSKQKNADGSQHSTSNPHGPTSGTR